MTGVAVTYDLVCSFTSALEKAKSSAFFFLCFSISGHTAQARQSSQQDLLPQQTNIHLSVSPFGLLLLFPKNLTSLRSFFLGVPKKRYALWGIFSGAPFPSTSYPNRQISICPFRLLVYCSSFPKTLLLFVHSGFREPFFNCSESARESRYLHQYTKYTAQ